MINADSAPVPFPAEGFVLAGGASSRMGRDKALVSIDGTALIARALAVLGSTPLAAPARIAGARTDLRSFASVVADLHPGCGPLAGIEAGLTASSQSLNLFLAVDLPFVPSKFLRWLLERASLSGAEITYPCVLGQAQPLSAVYRRSCLPRITASLAAGNYKVGQMLEAEASNRSRSTIDRFDLELISAVQPEIACFSHRPWREWFRNLNSPRDLLSVERS